MTRLAVLLLGAALALWFAFDRIWPRLPAALFAWIELALLVAACLAGSIGWWKARSRGALVALGMALGGLGLWVLVAALGLRFTP